MILNTIFWIMAICASGTATGLILYFCEFYRYWYGILCGVLVEIAAIPFVWAAIFIVWLLLCFIVSLFLNLEKVVKKYSRVCYWITFQTTGSCAISPAKSRSSTRKASPEIQGF